MKDERDGVTPSPCPFCGKTLDAASHPSNPAIRPKPGDVTVCLYCANITIFADDMSLRKPTDEEMVEVAGDKRLMKLIKVIGEVNRMRKKGEEKNA